MITTRKNCAYKIKVIEGMKNDLSEASLFLE
jgi:hypothetical protein